MDLRETVCKGVNRIQLAKKESSCGSSCYSGELPHSAPQI